MGEASGRDRQNIRGILSQTFLCCETLRVDFDNGFIRLAGTSYDGGRALWLNRLFSGPAYSRAWDSNGARSAASGRALRCRQRQYGGWERWPLLPDFRGRSMQHD